MCLRQQRSGRCDQRFGLCFLTCGQKGARDKKLPALFDHLVILQAGRGSGQTRYPGASYTLPASRLGLAPRHVHDLIFLTGNSASGCIAEPCTAIEGFNPPPRDRVSKTLVTLPSLGLALAWTNRVRFGQCDLRQTHLLTTVHIGIDAKLNLLSLGYLYSSRYYRHSLWVHPIMMGCAA